MILLVTKIILSFFFALLLVWIAEWKSARVSGIISSLPNTSFIIMIFIGLEQGVTFSENASIYSIYGVLANLLLVTATILCSLKLKNYLLSFVPIAFYLVSLFFIVNYFPNNENMAFLICFVVWVFCIFLLKDIPLVVIKQNHKSKKSHILIKFLAISTVIITTTSLASIIGQRWAGAITTFPGVTIPVALFIAAKYDLKTFRSFLKGAIFAWLPTAFYFLLTSKLFSSLGVLGGSFFSLLMCLVFVFILDQILKIIKKYQNIFF